MLEGGRTGTMEKRPERPERLILADVFERVSKATYGPDWQKHVAHKFRVSEELVRDGWGKQGAPFSAVILIQMDFDRRLREMTEAQELFPKPPLKPAPPRH
jgi:hypothetical protein